ncbi:Hsp70 family protein [Spiroplasma poulsonii]|uniref:Hsp70 family protein n=1 Tax=Spiroplasma poulsonii TaxID=2138 RepID=UPI0038D3AB56
MLKKLGQKESVKAVTVPCWQCTTSSNKRCRKNCSLDVEQIINEPTAAALAYGDW